MQDYDKGPRATKRTIIEGDGFAIRTEDQLPPDEDEGRVGVVPEVVYEKYAVTREPCWGCVHAFRKPTQAGENKALDDLWNTYERNAESMSPPMLAKLLAAEFVRLIQKPSLENGFPCMPWPEDVIARHIGGAHTLDKKTDLRNMLWWYSTFEKVLADNVVTENRNEPGYKVNEKRLKAMLDLGERKLKVWAMLKE